MVPDFSLELVAYVHVTFAAFTLAFPLPTLNFSVRVFDKRADFSG